MKVQKVLGLMFTFIGGFVAAVVVCYHVPLVRVEVPSFIFAVAACLIVGALFTFGKKIV